MFKRNQKGSVAVITVIAILSVLVIGLSVFVITTYSTSLDYKNNSDRKAAEAVEAAKDEREKELRAKFDEEYKKPNLTYRGPSSYGSVSFDYPKTWSAYVEEGGSELVNGYFYPQVVPSTQSNAAFALRVEIVNTSYSEVVEQYESVLTDGKLKARAFIPPKMDKVGNILPGLRYDGDLGESQTPKNGAMVVIQVRDKTLKLYTESANFLGDFNNIVLPSLTFSP